MNVSRRLGDSVVSDSHDYADALRKSLLFFRAQRSGNLGKENPIPWRAAPSFLSDGADVGADLSRGYFDAGDYVKYGQPAAYTVSVLAWGVLEFAPGFQRAGAVREVKAAVRWGTDYILNAANQLGDHCTYHAQVTSQLAPSATNRLHASSLLQEPKPDSNPTTKESCSLTL